MDSILLVAFVATMCVGAYRFKSNLKGIFSPPQSQDYSSLVAEPHPTTVMYISPPPVEETAVDKRARLYEDHVRELREQEAKKQRMKEYKRQHYLNNKARYQENFARSYAKRKAVRAAKVEAPPQLPVPARIVPMPLPPNQQAVVEALLRIQAMKKGELPG